MTIAEILQQAGLALSGLLLPPCSPGGAEKDQEIVLDAPDRATLLVDWLNELLYLADRDRWVATHIDLHDVSETHLRAAARGPVLDQAPALVKAATWHNLRFEVRDGAFEAEVVLDV
jgi:SHS2 domain-containing protein